MTVAGAGASSPLVVPFPTTTAATPTNFAKQQSSDSSSSSESSSSSSSTEEGSAATTEEQPPATPPARSTRAAAAAPVYASPLVLPPSIANFLLLTVFTSLLPPSENPPGELDYYECLGLPAKGGISDQQPQHYTSQQPPNPQQEQHDKSVVGHAVDFVSGWLVPNLVGAAAGIVGASVAVITAGTGGECQNMILNNIDPSSYDDFHFEDDDDDEINHQHQHHSYRQHRRHLSPTSSFDPNDESLYHLAQNHQQQCTAAAATTTALTSTSRPNNLSSFSRLQSYLPWSSGGGGNHQHSYNGDTFHNTAISYPDIRKAYKQKCRQLHPDKILQHGHKCPIQAAAEYDLVQQAYTCLSNPHHRTLYHQAQCSNARYKFLLQGTTFPDEPNYSDNKHCTMKSTKTTTTSTAATLSS